MPIQLSAAEIADVERKSDDWKRRLGLSRAPFEYTNGCLLAHDVTGFVQVGGVLVEVAPKFLPPSAVATGEWRTALIRILARTYRRPEFLGWAAAADSPPATSLPDLLGMILVRGLQMAAASGLPHGYAERREDLGTMRGRLDVGRVHALLAQPWSIPCVFEELSLDITVNRLLKWAAQQLTSIVTSARLSHELFEAAEALVGVAGTPPSVSQAERIRLSPFHSELEPSVRVARLLLFGRGLRYEEGSFEPPGFLWDSSTVFEDFARSLVGAAVGRYFPSWSVLKVALPLAAPQSLGTRRLTTTPDIRVQSEDWEIVFDAKYKVWKGSPLSADIYQVVTGAWLVNASETCLIYPSPSADRRPPAVWQLLGNPPPARLWALFINLTEMASSKGEDRITDALAEDLRSISQASLQATSLSVS